MGKITFELLKEKYESGEMGAYGIVVFAEDKIGDLPQKPTLPQINNVDSPYSVRAYIKDLEQYAEDLEDYQRLITEIQTSRYEIQFEIEKFIKYVASIHIVPKQYQDKVYAKAYELGHSSGYGSVLSNLEHLVEIFEE